jgi:hypothetical protein
VAQHGLGMQLQLLGGLLDSKEHFRHCNCSLLLPLCMHYGVIKRNRVQYE